MVSRVKDLFEAEAGSFGDTMMAHNGVAGYKVPEYQRQYNWKQEHLRRLLADCLNGFYRLETSSDPEYTFLGSIILATDNRSEPTFDGASLIVVDGQQRLRWTPAHRSPHCPLALSALFCRVEATLFANGANEPNANAVRLGLTSNDGSEVVRVVRIRDEDEPAVQELAARLEQVLGEATTLKLAAFCRVLRKSLIDDSLGRNPTSSSDSSGLNDLPEGAS